MFCRAAVLSLQCEEGEFECDYAADGCVPWRRVNDGEVHCLRDGLDETRESFRKIPDAG